MRLITRIYLLGALLLSFTGYAHTAAAARSGGADCAHGAKSGRNENEWNAKGLAENLNSDGREEPQKPSERPAVTASNGAKVSS